MAGGVSGGLWRSEDGGASWRKVTRPNQSPSITTIVQDPRPNKTNIWYFGTGEFRGNTANVRPIGGSLISNTLFTGTGVYKSINGGRSFQLLEATDDSDVQQVSPFDFIQDLAVHPETGVLFVATNIGIFMSKDEGVSFSPSLVIASDKVGLQTAQSQVGISPTGKVYATIGRSFPEDPNGGFSVSSDSGTTWKNLRGGSGFFDAKVLIAFDPNNPTWVYFMGDSRFLSRYDSSISNLEEAFVDLNMPNGDSRTGVNFQQAYNMVLAVHPKYSNIMFIGGTNLVRSVTGLTDPNEVYEIIGGINEDSMECQTLENLTVDNYTNHHADQHNLIFFPSDPNKALSANDGGVFKTDNILREEENEVGETVQWNSLNNGFITTQPYAVSFDHNTESKDLLAGFHDNGTWFTNSTDPSAPWIQDIGADGFYSAIANQGQTRYVSIQNGKIFKLDFNEQGDYLGFSRVTNGGAFSFETILELDPFDENILYYPSSLELFINKDLGLDGLGNIVESIPNPDTFETSEKIVSLGVSKYPIPHRVYFGSDRGKIFRVDNAISPNFREITEVHIDKGLPNGYVNDISVDPSNADRVIAVFSNYGIPSVFFTEDGGDTWQDISGDLEENIDGSGNGPSVRCAGFFGSGDSTRDQRSQNLYVGTSTGLYRARIINGQNTRWRREPFKIGNAVVEELVIRKDGFIAAAVHGNGLVSAKFPVSRPLPESDLELTKSFRDTLINLNEGVSRMSIPISRLLVSKSNKPITFDIRVSNEEVITAATVENDSLIVESNGLIEGVSELYLTGKNGKEQASVAVTINYLDYILNQNEKDRGEIDIFSTIYTDNYIFLAADDFMVPNGQVWEVDRTIGYGDVQGDLTNFVGEVEIYSDNNGIPGERIYIEKGASDFASGAIDLNLAESITLEAGTYWVSIRAYIDLESFEGSWRWQSETNKSGAESHYFDPSYMDGWVPTREYYELEDPLDQKFSLHGSIVNVSNNNAKNLEGSIKEKLTLDIYPNPFDNLFCHSFAGL